jgi:hypothetical protein
MDLSYVAFEKLAEAKWGVIGIQYRVVDCPAGTPPPQDWQLTQRNRGLRSVMMLRGSRQRGDGNGDPSAIQHASSVDSNV